MAQSLLVLLALAILVHSSSSSSIYCTRAVLNLEKGNKELEKVGTQHTEKCPECGGVVAMECRSEDKGKMTIYGTSGVRHVLHVVHRCQERGCRAGLFFGYRIVNGKKMYEDNCLEPDKKFLGKITYLNKCSKIQKK